MARSPVTVADCRASAGCWSSKACTRAAPLWQDDIHEARPRPAIPNLDAGPFFGRHHRPGASLLPTAQQRCPDTTLQAGGSLMSTAWLTSDWLWNVLWALYIIVIGLWVVLQKRPPVSTLTWILFLSFVPVVGFVIYYFFGP